MHVKEAPAPLAHRSYYTVLGLSFLASDEEIRSAFRKLALRHHPDRHPCDAHATARFCEIVEAYSVLGDPGARAVYDRACEYWLCVEEYLQEFSELLLTVSGLGLRTHGDDALGSCRAADSVSCTPAGLLTV